MFVPLFNGKDLEGWIQRGGAATYQIEGDSIVGISTLETPNSFLCTEKNYSDFVLKLEVKIDEGLNSGIQIRSEVNDAPREVETKNANGESVTKTIPAGRVYGYQVEIDPSARSWSGGIYDEARRGWLFTLEGDEHEQARAAFRPGEWNQYKIRAVGTTLKTWINGVLVAHLTDEMTSEGLIGLQVHRIGKSELAGKKIRWRNLTIREVTKYQQK
jgi:hypothetical protein